MSRTIDRRAPERTHVLAFVAIALVGAVAASADVPSSSKTLAPFPGSSWPEARPEERGLDPILLTELTSLLEEGRRFRDIHSLLVVKDGFLITEAYFAGWTPDRLHTLQSVSKSVTSAPLGIRPVHWFRNREGHPHMGGGLDLRPRDLARFALLFLRQGRWGDRQIVPATWVRDSTSARLSLNRPASRVTGYGYLWWIHAPAPGDRQPIPAAHGFMGQYIFLVPEHDLAVVVTAGARGADQRAPVDFLYSHILPAVKRTQPNQ